MKPEIRSFQVLIHLSDDLVAKEETEWKELLHYKELSTVVCTECTAAAQKNEMALLSTEIS